MIFRCGSSKLIRILGLFLGTNLHNCYQTNQYLRFRIGTSRCWTNPCLIRVTFLRNTQPISAYQNDLSYQSRSTNVLNISHLKPGEAPQQCESENAKKCSATNLKFIFHFIWFPPTPSAIAVVIDKGASAFIFYWHANQYIFAST